MSETRMSRWLAVGANLAVLLGLVFVGIEVRNSRAAAEAQSADGYADGFLQINLTIVGDSAVARMWDQGHRDPEELTDVEAVRVSQLMRALFNQYQRVHRLYRSGLLTDEEWAFTAREAASAMRTPLGELYFEGNDLPSQFLDDLEPHRDMPSGFDGRLGRAP